MHVPLQLHVPWPLHMAEVTLPHLVHEQSAPQYPALHRHEPQSQAPLPPQTAPFDVGHAAVEHEHDEPVQPDAHEHSPVRHSHVPLFAHDEAHPWHATHTATELTIVPVLPLPQSRVHAPPLKK